MAEKELEEKEIEESGIPYQNIRYVQKYGITKKELETIVQNDFKFSSSFELVADYLLLSRRFIKDGNVIECGYLIERAKYVLRGCKDSP